MSGFKPTRTSPPSKLTGLTESFLNSTLSTDLSRSSSVSIKELIGLTHGEVELLDAIIARAGASATTFPAVFSAYNAVLKERGLDPSEVVFYGKLLKLGTLKGTNWGEKWRMVKVQQGYGNTARSSHLLPGATPKPMKSAPTRPTRLDLPSTVPRHTGSSTLHSRENESTNVDFDDEESISVNVPQYHLLKRPAAMRSASPVYSEITSATLDSRKHPPLAPNSRSRPMPPLRRQMWETDPSDASEHHGAPSTTPPSYRAAVREPEPARRRIITPTSPSPTKRPSSSSLAAARQLVAQAKERKGSVLNEDDAWKKVAMLQDEKNADAFRQDRLVERYWEMWREGFQLIITAHREVGRVREKHILGECIHRWRTRTAKSRERFEWVADRENNLHLQAAFRLWREKRKEKKQARWRALLRSNMKKVRDKREQKLMKDAMVKWRQTYQTYSADRHYAKSLLLRYYDHWRKRVAHLDHLDDVADRLSLAVQDGVLERSWHRWKHAFQLELACKVVADNVNLRVKTEVMDVWRRQIRDNHTADAYYDIVLKKRIFRSWKSARDRIQSMENRAAAHAVIRDLRFLRAVYMVMKFRYQERRRRLKDAWAVWKIRLQQHKKLEDAAVAFSLRRNSPVVGKALQKWRKVCSAHKKRRALAASHHSKSLRRRIVLAWRIKLWNEHELMTKARDVDKYLVVRSAFTVLKTKFLDRKQKALESRLKALDLALKAWELRRTRAIFYVWFERAHRQRAQRLAEKQAEEYIRARIIKRIQANALSKWLNRTVDVKDRHQRAPDAWFIRVAFRRWKRKCMDAQKHHANVDSLMESHLLVEREDLLKKTFHRWLSIARTARRRRLTLEQKEAEFELDYLSDVWDKWRDRFKQQRLQPVEYDAILQRHQNTLTRTFRLWHSKTKPLPAIRFDALRIKRMYWNLWREALPRALQTKTARDIEKKAVLSKFFDKWLQAHRTKMALKAVARARYLRLPPAPIRPTPTSRPVPPSSRPAASNSRPAPVPISRSVFPRRAVRTEEQSSEDDEPGPSWRQKPVAGPRSLRSDTSPPRRSHSRFSIPATRASSPTRSTFGMRLSRESTVFPTRPASSVTGEEKRGSSLFRELRQLRGRTRSPSEHSRTREPP